MIKKGCELFTEWGWKSGSPSGLTYEAVECPSAFVDLIGNAFGPSGVTWNEEDH